MKWDIYGWEMGVGNDRNYMSSGKIQVWIEADKLIGAWLNLRLMEEPASGEERKGEEEGEDRGRKS